MTLSDPPCDCDQSCAIKAERLVWPSIDKGPKKWHLCPYCGDGGEIAPTSKDHIVPVSKGGGNRRSNLVMVCGRCNRDKGDYFLIEWLWRLERKSDRRAKFIRAFLKCRKHAEAFTETRLLMRKNPTSGGKLRIDQSSVDRDTSKTMEDH